MNQNKSFTPAKNDPPPFKANLGTIRISRIDYNLATIPYGGNWYTLQRSKEVEDYLVFNEVAKCVVSFQIYRNDDGTTNNVAIPRLHFELTSPPNGTETIDKGKK